MNVPFVSAHPPAPPVRLRTGLLLLAASLVTVVVMGWGVARATAQVAGLEGEQQRVADRLAGVEQVIGGFPTTVANTTHVAASAGS